MWESSNQTIRKFTKILLSPRTDKCVSTISTYRPTSGPEIRVLGHMIVCVGGEPNSDFCKQPTTTRLCVVREVVRNTLPVWRSNGHFEWALADQKFLHRSTSLLQCAQNGFSSPSSPPSSPPPFPTKQSSINNSSNADQTYPSSIQC